MLGINFYDQIIISACLSLLFGKDFVNALVVEFFLCTPVHRLKSCQCPSKILSKFHDKIVRIVNQFIAPP